MKVAVVDHSYHRLTRSTEMIPGILRRRGMEVDVLWDDSWRGGAAVELEPLLGKYDAFVFFQTPARYPWPYARAGANIVFIPMLDEYPPERLRDRRAFLPRFDAVKFICFSVALHRAVAALGLASLPVRYFPDPAEFAADMPDDLTGFFWQRRPDRIPWSLVRRLVADADFRRIHVHLAADPPHPTVRPDGDDPRLTFSEWFDDPAQYRRLVADAQVYFAPRPSEGIGMSFLEAMAMGRCVVAPEAGTMNEYVEHGRTGLLYDLDRPAPLEFSRVRDLGRAARESVERGHAEWVAMEQTIADFVAEPPRRAGLLAKLRRWATP